MSTFDDLPLYHTKSVSVSRATPISPRRRSLPGRVGPWPIKRTRSDPDRWALLCGSIWGDPFEESKAEPSLKAVLKRIDEECATIDMLVSKENAVTTIDDVEQNSSKEDTKQRKAGPPVDLERKRTSLLVILLALAMYAVFVWPLMMIFMFGNWKRDRVLLKKGAPPVAVFGLILAVPIGIVTVGLLVSIYFIEELQHKRNVLRDRHEVFWMARRGLTFGIFAGGCALIWMLTLMGHE